MSTMGDIGRQLFGIVLGGACVLVASCATAQITPDRTLPNNSNVMINGSVFNITGGTQAGRNLFHSFQQFSVPTGGTASFNNGLDIQNIISRVTGGEVSNIDGIIRASGTANLFFLNPNGIVFRKNASLNVGGSFLATTANAIQFGNQGIFSATNPEAFSPLLTINPSALLFNQIATAPIQNNSSMAPAGKDLAGIDAFGLRVPDGKSLLLVGGNINMDGGQLNAFGGRVELATLAAPGTIGLNVAGDTLSLSVPNDVQRGNISLKNQASVDVTGAGRGDIAVNAGNLEISNSYLLSGIGQGLGDGSSKAGDINIKVDSISLSNKAQISNTTFGQGNAGNVIINATKGVTLADKNTQVLSTVGFINNSLNNLAIGKGGNIQITTDQLSLTNGALIVVSTFGKGNAGNVIINASKSVSLKNGAIFSNVGDVDNLMNDLVKGNSGNIQITTDQLSLTNRALVETSTFGQGNAGNVIINATKTVSINNADIGTDVGNSDNLQNNLAIGKGGNIQITTDQLSLTNRSQLQASTFGQGNAGNIQITTDQLSLSSIAQLQANTFGQGTAGNIIINADKSIFLDHGVIQSSVGSIDNPQNNLTIGNGGNIQITTSELSLTNGAIFLANTFGQGNAGNIQITTGKLSLTNGAQFLASTFGLGNAGNVTVNALDAVSLVNADILSTVEVGGVGKGGNININAATLSLIDSAQLLTLTRGATATQPAGTGNAGDVNVKVTREVDIAGQKNSFLSGIGSFVGPGTVGNGGNITIDSGSFSLRNGAQLSTSTFGQGNAGNVTVNALDAVSLANASILSTVEAGGVGKGGNININGATLSLKDGAQLLTLTRGATNTQPAGRGDAGNVNVKVTREVDIAGEKNGLPSAIFSLVDTGTVGNGGNITIDSGSFSLRDGDQLSASTFGQGNAGTIKVNAAANVTISGKSSNFNSGLYVNSQSTTGTAGDIIVTSPRITLDDSGTLSAESASGNGGNINLQSGLLLLRRGSLISTTAGPVQKGGDGGNITINSKFIIAIPEENSDITANAFTGNGGSVMINTQGIFGTQFRPQLTDKSDITASSTFGVSGIVSINAPDTSFLQNSLNQLPQNLINTNTLIANSCIARTKKQQGTFNITGPGGLPNRPLDASISSYPTGTVRNVQGNSISSSWHKGDPVVEPQAIYKLPNGHLVLSRECS